MKTISIPGLIVRLVFALAAAAVIPLCAEEAGADAATGSLVIQCPVACRISIPGLQVSGDAPKERLQLSNVRVGSYPATFSGFNREVAHTIVIAAGQTTRLTVKIAQGKVVEERGETAAVAPAAKSADPFAAPSFVIPDLGGATMVAVAPGTFIMGSNGPAKNERPLMRVTLTHRYWLSRTEVTQAQWLSIMDINNSRLQGPNQPVEQVSWNEAMEFCQRLTRREAAAGRLPEGYFYVLPLEAQWEYACRAGGEGSTEAELREIGWYQANSGDRARPAGLRPTNKWGFQDMRGNVAEWCYDWLGSYPGGAMVDYAGPGEGTQRVLRGGAFNFVAVECRATSRAGDAPDRTHPNVGFRLALISLGGAK